MSKRICYCYNYTADDIMEDVKKNGRSTVMEHIASEKRGGRCRCAEKNPKGQ